MFSRAGVGGVLVAAPNSLRIAQEEKPMKQCHDAPTTRLSQ